MEVREGFLEEETSEVRPEDQSSSHWLRRGCRAFCHQHPHPLGL